MPIILKPDTIVETTLPCESHKPEADRIVWLARALSCSDAITYEADRDKVFSLHTIAEQSAAFNALIKRIATGWKNVVDEAGNPVAFDDSMLDQFSLQMKIVIAAQLPSAAGWSAAEKKA